MCVGVVIDDVRSLSLALASSLLYIETEHYCTPKYAIPKGKFCDSSKWKPVCVRYSKTKNLRQF